MNDDLRFQWIGRSKGFFLSAQFVVSNKQNNSLYRAPVIHLIGHGLELLLKYIQISKGMTADEVRKKYGHNLLKLWQDEKAACIQIIAYEAAKTAWEHAEESGLYEQSFTDDPIKILEQQIECLSRLHTGSSNFAARFPNEKNEKTPIPLFLLDTFIPTVEKLLLQFEKDE